MRGRRIKDGRGHDKACHQIRQSQRLTVVPSIHVRASKSFHAHAYDFVKENFVELPSLMQQFCLMHQRGEVFSDTKSSMLNRKQEKITEAEVAELEASSVDKDQIFMDVFKEFYYVKKRRPYGIDSRASLSTDGSYLSIVSTSLLS